MQIPSASVYLAQFIPHSSSIDRQISTGTTASSAGSFATPDDHTTFSQAARAQAERPPTADKLASTGTYDFRQITPERLLEVINDLIVRGTLSLDDTSSLVGILPIALDGGPPPAEYYKPANVFSLLERSLNFNMYVHNDTAVVYDRMALSALRRLQGTSIEG